jgi:hypothetical protein
LRYLERFKERAPTLRENLGVDVIRGIASEKIEDVDTTAEGCDQGLLVQLNKMIDIVADIVKISRYW